MNPGDVRFPKALKALEALSKQGGDEERCGCERKEDGTDEPAQCLGLTLDGRREPSLLLGNVEQRFLNFGEAAELFFDVPELC